MIEPHEDEVCEMCRGHYEPLWNRMGIRVKIDRDDVFLCPECVRRIVAAAREAVHDDA